MSSQFNRRRVLRGMLGGAGVTVGLPLLDCFLNTNGTALASGAPMPVCFASWFAGLGYNPGRWEPKVIGKKYDMNVELAPLQPFKDKINIYSGMKCFTDAHANQVHSTGIQVCLGGGISGGGQASGEGNAFPTLDTLVADAIGTKTRFRSLEVSCDGSPGSHSSRGGKVVNPSEVSPVALYTRIFGPDFKDPNAASFTPDPEVMVRRSALSMVKEERDAFMRELGTADKARLDEYFSSLRGFEQQLDIQLQKPAPLEACTVPGKEDESKIGTLIEDVRHNHKLFSMLLAHALACGQTRVLNVAFTGATSPLRLPGSGRTMHIYSHEEPIDPTIGCQAELSRFMVETSKCMADFLAALDSIKEGGGTLLDRSLMIYTTDTGLAKVHGVENMPLITAGGAAGRIKTGIHFAAPGDPVTRVGLTVQQALGVAVGSWGTESNRTSKTITEVMA